MALFPIRLLRFGSWHFPSVTADFGCFGRTVSCAALQFGLRFLDGVTRVILRVLLFGGAIIGDALDDFLGIVASREARFA